MENITLELLTNPWLIMIYIPKNVWILHSQRIVDLQGLGALKRGM